MSGLFACQGHLHRYGIKRPDPCALPLMLY